MKKAISVLLILVSIFLISSCGAAAPENKSTIELNEFKEKIDLGEKFKVKYTTDPIDARVKFETSNPKIATVSITGVVEGISVGTATITLRLVDDVSVSASFTVKVGIDFGEMDLSDIPLDEELWPVRELEKGSDEEAIYMALREKVAQIARGKENSTVINVSNIPLKSPETDGVQILRVMGLLWLSCPFDLYWYEEQSGFYFDYSYSGSSLNLTIKMPVSQDYRKGQYEIDENKKVVALKALQNAIKIADEATGSDYDKIMYFKNKICELVKYDTASNNDQIKGKIKAGNNPWQMVSVFDNNTSTNVVCAGYSKAFKYLCDRAGIECKVVNGVCGGAHVWNVVTLEGKNYIVDVTNCDSGSSGFPDKLILVGAEGSIADGYKALGTPMVYRYYTAKDSGVTDMEFVFGTSGLIISNTSYER